MTIYEMYLDNLKTKQPKKYKSLKISIKQSNYSAENLEEDKLDCQHETISPEGTCENCYLNIL